MAKNRTPNECPLAGKNHIVLCSDAGILTQWQKEASIDQHPEMNLRSINKKVHGTKEHAPGFH